MGYTLIKADVLEHLAQVRDNTYDAAFCDPPYALGFMNSHWDKELPGADVWAEILRVCKPGAHLLSFGGTRTFHRLMCYIEDGGWILRDTICWTYGTGFPKSVRLEKLTGDDVWTGYGSALKPAWEPITVAMKPLDKNYANNALQWQLAGLNIEGCRVPIEDGAIMARNNAPGDNGWKNSSGGPNTAALEGEPSGRWPANLVLDGSDEVLAAFPTTGKSTGGRTANISKTSTIYGGGKGLGQDLSPDEVRGDPGYGDQGSAARFFYCAKASQAERNAGLSSLTGKKRDESRNAEQASMNGGEGNPYNRGAREVKNHHPTVKPLALTTWLATLIVPPAIYRNSARLFVPYCGSGSEIVGALKAGWRNIDAIDSDMSYLQIADLRIEHHTKGEA